MQMTIKFLVVKHNKCGISLFLVINPLQCNNNALLFFQAYCEDPSLLLKVKELIVWFCHTLSVGITLLKCLLSFNFTL